MRPLFVKLLAAVSAAVPIAAAVWLVRPQESQRALAQPTATLQPRVAVKTFPLPQGHKRIPFQTNDCGWLRARGTYSETSSRVWKKGFFVIHYNPDALRGARWEMVDAEVEKDPDVLYTNAAGPESFPLTGWQTATGEPSAPTFEMAFEMAREVKRYKPSLTKAGN